MEPIKPHCSAAWNTGRLYQRNGQIIAAIYCDGVISFYDVSRMIDGTIPVAAGVHMTADKLQSLTMQNYDHGNYTSFLDNDMRAKLRVLADAVQS